MEFRVIHEWDGGPNDCPNLLVVHYTRGGIGFLVAYGSPLSLRYSIHPDQVEPFALALEKAAAEARAIVEAQRADYREAEGRG